MDSPQDLVFAGARRVVVVGGARDFVPHAGAGAAGGVHLAGRYAQPVDPATVSPEQAAGLFGAFVLLRHDAAARRLHVLTDRFGLYPLYIASGTTLHLATDLDALRRLDGVAGASDSGALSDIVAFNVPLDQRTPWSGIRGVGGGRHLEIDLDTLAVTEHRTWRPEELLAQGDLSFDAVKDRLVELFLEGVRLATEGRPAVAVTLSGGADSRCLLAASLHAARPTVVYSTGVPGSRALAYAHSMAGLVGVRDFAHPLGPEFVARFPELMRESSALMQGMSFSSELEAMWLRAHVAPEGVLLHGAFAELYKIGKMHNFPYEPAVDALAGPALAEHLWKRFATRYEQRRKGLAAPLAAALGEQAREHLAEKVQRHGRGLDPAGVLQMIYIEEFLGKVAKASWRMWEQRLPAFFPFAYPPLVDLILRVRTPEKVTNRFVVHLLRKTSPALARHPDSNTGVRLGASRLHREVVHVFDYIVNRLRPKARADHQDFAAWLAGIDPPVEAVFAELQGRLGEFDPGHVKALAARCRAGEDLPSRSLQFLWAWGLWRQGVAP